MTALILRKELLTTEECSPIATNMILLLSREK